MSMHRQDDTPALKEALMRQNLPTNTPSMGADYMRVAWAECEAHYAAQQARITELQADLGKVTAERDATQRRADALAEGWRISYYARITLEAAIPVAYQMGVEAGAEVAEDNDSMEGLGTIIAKDIRAIPTPEDLVERVMKEELK